jgi:Fur family ferric uptake transcriptional regulator
MQGANMHDFVPSDRLRTRLRLAQLRGTSARLGVLAVLEQTSGPKTHLEVYELLAHTGLDRATVYRNLVTLAEQGFASRTDLGDHVWRFELLDEGGHEGPRHAHYVCTDCGEVSCMKEVEVEMVSPPSRPGAPGKVSEILFKGVCDKCDNEPSVLG